MYTDSQHSDFIEHLLLWALDRLDEAIQEGRVEVVKSYTRAVEYLASQQAGMPKTVIIAYRAEDSEPRPNNRQLRAA